MIENPFEQALPDDVIEQIRVFARDLAYGVVNNLWNPSFDVTKNHGRIINWKQIGSDSHAFDKYMKLKWSKKLPDDTLLLTFGYVHEIGDGRYILSEKAFQLLELPTKSPTIFISYGHKQSSELALLIEARLRYVDKQIGIFIDKSIPLGEGWHNHLEEQVKSAEYFICLLGQHHELNPDGTLTTTMTIDREPVQKEIRWALDADRTIIFICHRGYSLPTEQNDISDSTWKLIGRLREKQGIFVDQQSAEEYETTINKLLNRLQYPTF